MIFHQNNRTDFISHGQHAMPHIIIVVEQEGEKESAIRKCSS
jgi:hypothetical protein